MTTTTKENTRDIHSRANIDPSAYTWIGWLYQGPTPGVMAGWGQSDKFREMNRKIHKSTYVGHHKNKGNCDHCGASFHYGDVFEHDNGDVIVVGHICAQQTMELPDAAAVAHKNAQREAKRLRNYGKLQGRIREILDANPELEGIFETYASDEAREAGIYDSFIAKGRDHLFRYGQIRDRYIAALVRAAARNRETAERKAAEAAEPKVDCPTGRVQLEGTVLGIRWQTNAFGETLKALVKIDTPDGSFKVWGTAPAAVMSDVSNGLKGCLVRFTAKVTQSNDDKAFGFFSRPTKAQLLAEPVLAD